MPLKLSKRGTGYWAHGSVGDQPVRLELSTGNRALALRRLADLEIRLDALQPMPWQEVRRRFLGNYAGPTAKSYRLIFDALERAFPSKLHPHEISLLELEAFVQRSVRKPNSIRLEVIRLRSIWKWAHNRKIVSDNIARKLQLPRQEYAATLPFKSSELVAIETAIHARASDPTLVGQGTAQTIHARTWAMYQVLRTTGIRVSDLIRLRPGNFVDDHLVFHTQKTSASVRIVVVDVLRSAMDALVVRPSGYYFWSGRNAETCGYGVGRTFRTLGKRAGVVGVRPHRFRHTFAATMLASGADIRLVSRMLGHRTIRATERSYSVWIKVYQDQADAAVVAAEQYSVERRKAGASANRDFEPVDPPPGP